MASELKSQIDEAAAAFVRARAPVRPEVGIILGTGLGDFAGALESERRRALRATSRTSRSRPSRATPASCTSARSPGAPVAVMKGRVHYYEGYTMQQVAFPVRVLKALGCDDAGHHQRVRRHEPRHAGRARSWSPPTTST